MCSVPVVGRMYMSDRVGPCNILGCYRMSALRADLRGQPYHRSLGWDPYSRRALHTCTPIGFYNRNVTPARKHAFLFVGVALFLV